MCLHLIESTCRGGKKQTSVRTFLQTKQGLFTDMSTWFVKMYHRVQSKETLKQHERCGMRKRSPTFRHPA